MTLAIAAYLAQLEARGLSPVTLELTRAWLGRFASFCRERQLELGEVTAQVLAGYHTRLLWQSHGGGRLYTPNSVDQALRHVRAFLRWAAGEGHLRHDPTQGLVLGRPKSRPRPTWSPAEQEALLGRPDASTPVGQRDRALLGLFFEGPLSWQQCAGLDLADFDPAGYRLATHRGRQRKGPLMLVMSDGLAELLSTYLALGRPQLVRAADEPAFFLNDSGRRFQAQHVAQRVRAYLRQAPSFLNRRP